MAQVACDAIQTVGAMERAGCVAQAGRVEINAREEGCFSPENPIVRVPSRVDFMLRDVIKGAHPPLVPA